MLVVHALEQRVFKEILAIDHHIKTDIKRNCLRLALDIRKIFGDARDHVLGDFMELCLVEGVENVIREKRQAAHVAAYQIETAVFGGQKCL